MKRSFSCIYILIGLMGVMLMSCSGSKSLGGRKAKVANIDLSHWKVTIPTPRADGKALEVSPPEIFDYANNEVLKEFMYNDSTDGSIVFHAYPASTTANTKYSRTELREQMEPGNNHRNWTFKEGGRMKVKMSVPKVSRGDDGKEHRVIIAQIHGRLSNEQKKMLGQKDNNAPPILKVYWSRGKIRVKTKVLKDLRAPDKQILGKEAWGDDEGHEFEEEVGRRKFTLEVIVSEGRLEVVLNGYDSVVYENEHMKRWGVFENYFKVGNYFQSRDKGSFGQVKIYDLEVSH